MKCENCNKEHDGNYGSGRFCCKECARGFSTKAKRKEINEKVSKKLNPNKTVIKCFNCQEKTSKGRTLYNNQQFCSVKCKKEFLWKFYCKEIKKQKKFIGPNIKRNAKKYLLEINGNRCAICGMIGWWNGKSLIMIMDHIDGNSSNWSINNLRLICANCDHQLPTFGSRNFGNGNIVRREYARKKYHMK